MVERVGHPQDLGHIPPCLLEVSFSFLSAGSTSGWVGVVGNEVGELDWRQSTMGLGCQANDSGLFPEGDMEALEVLKQRSNIHAFIYPLAYPFIYLGNIVYVSTVE